MVKHREQPEQIMIKNKEREPEHMMVKNQQKQTTL